MCRIRPLGWPLQVYFVAFALEFVLVAGAAGAYVYVQSNANDRQSATDDANFAARKAANEIASGIDVINTKSAPAVSSLAPVFASPSGCVLGYAPLGAFDVGRIEVIRADGSVVCTSEISVPGGKPYAGQGWLQATTAVFMGRFKTLRPGIKWQLSISQLRSSARSRGLSSSHQGQSSPNDSEAGGQSTRVPCDETQTENPSSPDRSIPRNGPKRISPALRSQVRLSSIRSRSSGLSSTTSTVPARASRRAGAVGALTGSGSAVAGINTVTVVPRPTSE